MAGKECDLSSLFAVELSLLTNCIEGNKLWSAKLFIWEGIKMAEFVETVAMVTAAKAIAAGICMAFGGLGPALALGYIGGKTCQTVGANPASANVVRTFAYLALAMAETLGLMAFLTAMILIVKA